MTRRISKSLCPPAFHLFIGVVVLASGCEMRAPSPAHTNDAGTSPNASILPAPLVTEAPDSLDASAPADVAVQGIPADPAGRLLLSDAGPPVPESLRADPIPAESPTSREVSGITLDAVFRLRDVPAPHKAPEVSADGVREAQKLTSLSLRIDVSETGRMRIEFTSRALPLPAHAELRSRADRYGHIVLWPNATEYRVIPPGALRTVLGERRVDVTPLSVGIYRPQGEGRRLGIPTRKIELVASLGTLKLELGKVPEVGEGGALVCRALVEINGIDPKASACQPGEVPLSATYAWQEGGGISLDVTSLTKRIDMAQNNMLVPPPGIAFAPSGLPAAPHGIFLSRDELAAFRTSPLALPPPTDPTAPGEGFIAHNYSDTLYYLLLDGVPVVAVPAGSERYVIGPPRGRYVAQWRTFLGERIGSPQTVEIPARLSYGIVPDAGVPDGG